MARPVVPRIVVNAKVYAESTGPAGLALARALQRAAKAADEPVGYAAPATELALLAGKGFTHLPLWAQHIDPAQPGVGTGSITAEMAKLAGAQGSFLNHAEHKLAPTALDATIGRA